MYKKRNWLYGKINSSVIVKMSVCLLIIICVLFFFIITAKLVFHFYPINLDWLVVITRKINVFIIFSNIRICNSSWIGRTLFNINLSPYWQAKSHQFLKTIVVIITNLSHIYLNCNQKRLFLFVLIIWQSFLAIKIYYISLSFIIQCILASIFAWLAIFLY